MIARAIAVLLVLLAIWPRGAGVAAQPASLGTFPIAFTVALEGGAEVVDAPWLAERVAQAIAIFAPSGVSFVAREHRTMPEAHARMENRSDRHALGGLLVERSINVLVVSSLRDVDDPTIFRQGVHWRSRTFPGTHYVILSRISHVTTLAHELGHFFGNPHSDVPNNIMSYARDGSVPPFFDDSQLGRIRGRAGRFLRTGEIVP